MRSVVLRYDLEESGFLRIEDLRALKRVAHFSTLPMLNKCSFVFVYSLEMRDIKMRLNKCHLFGTMIGLNKERTTM